MPIDVGRIALIGLGTAGEFAQRALLALGATDILGVDPRGPAAPAAALLPTEAVLSELEALSDSLCETVIVSAATPAHPELLSRILLTDDYPGVRRIWCEKPMVSSVTAARQFWAKADERGCELRTLLHTAFAPEVVWAASAFSELQAAHGSLVGISSSFFDPYEAEIAGKQASLGGSWLDSGINALSVVLRFCDEASVDSAVGETPREARVQGTLRNWDGTLGRLGIHTSWREARDYKETILTMADGLTLSLVHSAGESVLTSPSGQVIDRRLFGKAPLWERYRDMFASYAAEASPVDVARRGECLLYNCLGIAAMAIGEII